MVVAIIGILASLLLPALNKTRKRVVLLQCMQRQRQLHAMYNLYSTDNDGCHPWTHGNRFPRAAFGLPTGFSLGDYGPFEIPAPYDFIGAHRGSAWDCVGDKYFGGGFQIVAGWQGTCSFKVNGITNQYPLSYPCTAASNPQMAGRRNAIRRDSDIGDIEQCQTFFTCFAESYSGTIGYVECATHDWQFGNPLSMGVSTWADGHSTIWRTSDSSFRMMFQQGSSSMWWNNE